VTDKPYYPISTELLEAIRAFLVDHHDIVDGPAGTEYAVRPNLAMSLTNELDEEMGIKP